MCMPEAYTWLGPSIDGGERTDTLVCVSGGAFPPKGCSVRVLLQLEKPEWSEELS
jgi:hypothetical protein